MNNLLTNTDIRKDIESLIDKRVPASRASLEHPSLQVLVTKPSPDKDQSIWLGLLGVLNGLLGNIPTGDKPKYIVAFYENETRRLEKFYVAGDIIKTS